jgi:arylsulfatase A-like enzyme
MRGSTLAALATLALVAQPGLAERPNIVMIISDDQGFTDFGFMGHAVVKTPHIDRLAEQSARFPNGYVPSSLCRPSLATLLTGLYPHQHQIHFNDPPDKKNRQQAERFIKAVPALPRVLAEAGYRSFQTGKFWEGNYRNAGFTAGMTHGDPKRGGRHGDVGLKIGREGMQPIYDFIDSTQGQPFFLWYAPFMPHTPYTPPQKYKRMYAGKGLHPRVQLYYAMCTWFDDTVGELMDYLDSKGLAENTLVLFVVDNGWITNTEANRPPYAPRSKRSPYEMGIRTPILIRWAGKTKPATHAELVSSVDLVPTALAAAGLGGQARKLPGVNLLPVAEGKAKLQRDTVFGEIFNHDARRLGQPANDLLYRWARSGPWKIIVPTDRDQRVMLFNLKDDPDERDNLADNPKWSKRRSELERKLDEWWTPGRQAAADSGSNK